jgi:glutamyl-tRNA synthetase
MTSSGVRTRIALPSAGSLHLGSARLALLNWLLARRGGGGVVLRVGDAVLPAGRTEPAGAAEQDLAWLGLTWDATVRPPERLARYAEAAAALKRSGRLYPCLESEQELRAKRDWRVRRGKSPVYDRAMLKLTPAQLAAAEAGGKRPHWRFRLSDGIATWHDLVLGRTEVKLPAHSDPVAIQADGTPLAVFTTVVDDLDHAVSHVVRGEDSVGASGVHLDIFAALGGDAAALRLGHVPQLRDEAVPPGLTLRRLRNDGVEPAAITAYLAAVGTGRGAELRAPPDLAATFDLAAMARVRPAFDIADLQALNRRVLRDCDFADVAARLPPGATEAFWLAVRGTIDLLGEAAGWWDVVAGTIVPPVIEGEAAFLRTALALLPAEPWHCDIWAHWSQALCAATGRSLAALVAPLRLALTGEDHGPELPALLPLIGRARVVQRLQLAAA